MSGRAAGPARAGVAGGGSVVRRRPASRRPSAALVAALAGLLLLPAAAGAHGGILLASAVAGPYRTQITAAPLVERGRPPAIDVTVYLSSTASSAPVSDATVRTTVVADGRTVRPAVRQIAGGYEAIVPVEDAFTVGRQTIDVQITGPEGSGRVTVRPMAPDGGPPVALIVVTAVLLTALCALAVLVRRRRSPAPGEVTVDG